MQVVPNSNPGMKNPSILANSSGSSKIFRGSIWQRKVGIVHEVIPSWRTGGVILPEPSATPHQPKKNNNNIISTVIPGNITPPPGTMIFHQPHQPHFLVGSLSRFIPPSQCISSWMERGVPFAFREVFPTLLKYTTPGEIFWLNCYMFFWCEIKNLPPPYQKKIILMMSANMSPTSINKPKGVQVSWRWNMVQDSKVCSCLSKVGWSVQGYDLLGKKTSRTND